MPVYIVHGGLGSGKTLASVGRLRDYAALGNRIAGNIDINLEAFGSSPNSKTVYTRVPDRPTAFDLEALGYGKPEDDFDEENNGLLVLDEIATWLNSRTWNEKGRAALIDWFVHARKYGWDIIFLVQFPEMMDSQIREALSDYLVDCSRLDRISIPVVSSVSKHFTRSGRPVRLPKVHIATLWYKGKIKADRWVYRATDLYSSYNTKQVISDDYPNGAHTLLSRWHLEGRYMEPEFRLTLPFVLLLPIRLLVVLAAVLSGYDPARLFPAKPSPTLSPPKAAI